MQDNESRRRGFQPRNLLSEDTYKARLPVENNNICVLSTQIYFAIKRRICQENCEAEGGLTRDFGGGEQFLNDVIRR